MTYAENQDYIARIRAEACVRSHSGGGQMTYNDYIAVTSGCLFHIGQAGIQPGRETLMVELACDMGFAPCDLAESVMDVRRDDVHAAMIGRDL